MDGILQYPHADDGERGSVLREMEGATLSGRIEQQWSLELVGSRDDEEECPCCGSWIPSDRKTPTDDDIYYIASVFPRHAVWETDDLVAEREFRVLDDAVEWLEQYLSAKEGGLT